MKSEARFDEATLAGLSPTERWVFRLLETHDDPRGWLNGSTPSEADTAEMIAEGLDPADVLARVQDAVRTVVRFARVSFELALWRALERGSKDPEWFRLFDPALCALKAHRRKLKCPDIHVLGTAAFIKPVENLNFEQAMARLGAFDDEGVRARLKDGVTVPFPPLVSALIGKLYEVEYRAAEGDLVLIHAAVAAPTAPPKKLRTVRHWRWLAKLNYEGWGLRVAKEIEESEVSVFELFAPVGP